MNYYKAAYKNIDNNKYYQYTDEENCVRLTIFKSGFIDFYNCVEEDPHFGAVVNTYNSQEIMQKYGIDIFLRKEKLIKLNSL